VFLWFFVFLCVALKFPLWPFHSWLPEVHVECTTEVSCLLAGFVLKIGFFGLYKFCCLCFFLFTFWFLMFVEFLVIGGLFSFAVVLLFFSDYKRIIATWSLLHICVSLNFMWHVDVLFLSLVFFCNLMHVLSSVLMFCLFGLLSDLYGLRCFLLMFGLFGLHLWSFCLLFCVLFNVDFPFMLMFYLDLLLFVSVVLFSFVFVLCFWFVSLFCWLSSFFVLVLLCFFSFVWLDCFLLFYDFHSIHLDSDT